MDCKYEYVGCEVKVIEALKEKHMKSYANKHMSFLEKRVELLEGKEEKKSNGLLEELSKENQELTEKLTTANKEATKSKETIDRLRKESDVVKEKSRKFKEENDRLSKEVGRSLQKVTKLSKENQNLRGELVKAQERQKGERKEKEKEDAMAMKTFKFDMFDPKHVEVTLSYAHPFLCPLPNSHKL